MARTDYRSTHVSTMVVMGESNAFGMCASDPRNEWVQVVANLLRDFQDEPIQVHNQSVPANVISSKSPGYRDFGDEARPAAMDRYEQDVIAREPDLVILAYGLNDSRCGYAVRSFLSDYDAIVRDVTSRTDSLVVLAGPYWNTQYDQELWDALPERPPFGAFSATGRGLVWSYVTGIRKLAKRYGCIFVDLFGPVEKCTWLLCDDQCHYNDVGHRVLGHLVFHGIASNCSFVGKKSNRLYREGGFGVGNTGGTNAMGRTVLSWRKP